jgi:Abnormal spindle-like microcephaly-assoc'd, ASPM-SPD-2-Hydin
MSRTAARSLALFIAVAALGWSASPATASDALTADPASLEFGNGDVHPQNQNNVFRSVTLTNVGASAVSVLSVTVTGADPSSFTLNNNGCGGAFLFPGQQCQVQLRFTPTVVGPVTAELDVEDDSGTTLVALNGTGITGTISASPSPLSFDAQPWYQGQTQGLQLFVGPDAGVQTSSATITGPDASAFYVAYGQNCFDQFFFPSNSCGVGIGLQAPGPGTYTAQLEVTSDGNPNPLVVPLTAVALNGPHLTLTPSPAAFGDVPVGQEATLTVTALNDGDYATQIGETVVVTGLPDVFFVTDNTCEGLIIFPGTSCTLTAHFKPAFAGAVNASVFLISGDGGRPVEVVGLNGTGLGGPAPPATNTVVPTGLGGSAPSPPATTVGLTGRAVAGRALGCGASTAPSAIAWLRDGRVFGGAHRARLALGDADVGARFACRASFGGLTLTSAASAPVRPRDLAGLAGAFIDRAVCRSTQAPSSLRAGGRSVALAAGRPATAVAPLVLSGAVALRVSVDGRDVGTGRRVVLAPRALARFADGAHRLRIAAGGAVARSTLALLPCRLALEVHGGPGRPSVVAVSARAGVRSIGVRLSGLRLRLGSGHLGELVFDAAGHPARRLDLTGTRTSVNGVTVVLRRDRLRVRGLPPEVGVVRLRFEAGVVTGRGGSGTATALLRGDRRATRARAPAAWQR